MAGRAGRAHNPEEAARRVRLLLLDVDGVLTDGGLYVLPGGGEAVRFDVRDGLGLVRARQEGLAVGFVSGRSTDAVRARAAELGVEEVHLGVKDKASVLAAILSRRGLTPEEVCYVGDDLPDIPVLEAVGLPVTVPEAPDEVVDAAAYVTRHPGGRGAVREVVDFVLRARSGASEGA